MHAEALRLSQESNDEIGLASTLTAQGIVAFYRGQFDRVQTCCQQSLLRFRHLNAALGIAGNLLFLGWTAYCQENYETARQLLEESTTLFNALGHPGFSTEACVVLAHTWLAFGDITGAYAAVEHTLSYERSVGNKENVAHGLCALGYIALKQNDLIQARIYFEGSLKHLMTGIWKFSRITLVRAHCLEGLGEIALARDQPVWTTLLFGAAEAVRTINGNYCLIRFEQTIYEYTLASARTQLGENSFSALWMEGRVMTPEQALAAEGRAQSRQPVPEVSSSHLTPTRTTQDMSQVHATPNTLLTPREVEILRLLAQGLTNN